MTPASDLWRHTFPHFTYFANAADITFKGIHMKFSGWRNWLATLAVSLVSVLPAQATLVTFEDVTPTLFSGSSIDSGIYRFTSDAFGFSGVDNAASFSAFANAPANASSQFLFALNNDGITMERIDGTAFDLQSFSAAFIAPFGGIGAGVFAGELTIVGSDTNGFDFEFFAFAPSDANGNFNFETVTLTNLASRAWTSFTFFACVYDANFVCNDTSNQTVQPQFALDNLQIPEPGGLVLMATALFVAGFVRRRQFA